MNLNVVKPRELPLLQPFYHLSRVRGVAYDTFRLLILQFESRRRLVVADIGAPEHSTIYKNNIFLEINITEKE